MLASRPRPLDRVRSSRTSQSLIRDDPVEVWIGSPMKESLREGPVSESNPRRRHRGPTVKTDREEVTWSLETLRSGPERSQHRTQELFKTHLPTEYRSPGLGGELSTVSTLGLSPSRTGVCV